MEDLYDFVGDTCCDEGAGDTFGCFGGLGRGFEKDCVSCEDGREDGVDGNEVWVAEVGP